jgi:hypothetical protein
MIFSILPIMLLTLREGFSAAVQSVGCRLDQVTLPH